MESICRLLWSTVVWFVKHLLWRKARLQGRGSKIQVDVIALALVRHQVQHACHKAASTDCKGLLQDAPQLEPARYTAKVTSGKDSRCSTSKHIGASPVRGGQARCSGQPTLACASGEKHIKESANAMDIA